MKVLMRGTAASPEGILHAGKVYDLPNETARKFLGAQIVHGSDKEGKPLFGGPAAERVTDPGVKATRLTARPDPEDVPEMELDEDYEALTEQDEDEEEDDEEA